MGVLVSRDSGLEGNMQKFMSFGLAVVMLRNPFHRNWRATWMPEFQAEGVVIAGIGFGLGGLIAFALGLALAVRGSVL